VDQRYWTLSDRALGPISFDLHRLGGDFVVRRADGLYAYQLATVVDDAELGVTDVVRGVDLLASAPRQVALASALGVPVPRYLHHPVLVAKSSVFRKLGKSTGAPPVTNEDPAPLLIALLHRLQVDLPADPALAAEPLAVLLDLARQNWRPECLPSGDVRV